MSYENNFKSTIIRPLNWIQRATERRQHHHHYSLQ